MFGADLMIRTNNTAFKQAPDAFHGVRVDIPTDPLFGAVVNCFMGCVIISDPAIGWVLISHQPFSSRLRIVLDERMEYLPVSFLSTFYLETDRAATFHGSEYHCLIVQIATTDVALL